MFQIFVANTLKLFYDPRVGLRKDILAYTHCSAGNLFSLSTFNNYIRTNSNMHSFLLKNSINASLLRINQSKLLSSFITLKLNPANH